MPFRVRITEQAKESLEALPTDDVRLIREKLEQVAEMSEGFSPVSRLWSRRIDVDMSRMRVHVAGRLVEFEIDQQSETVRVLSLTTDSSSVERA